jgi:predicted cation transporter
MMTVLICLTVLAVLLGPILLKPIERNVELFFLAAGGIVSTVMGQLNFPLVRPALTEPIALTSAVLVFGTHSACRRHTLTCSFRKQPEDAANDG